MQPDPRKVLERAAEKLAAGEITREEYDRIVQEARRTGMLEPPRPGQTRTEENAMR